MEKQIVNVADLEEFINKLVAEDKWSIDVEPEGDGDYIVRWIPSKKYTAFDGNEFDDESWKTEQGDIMLVQDMSEAHVRNCLRMMLRQARLQHAAMLSTLEAIMSYDNEEPDMSAFGDDRYTGPTLH